MLFIHPNILIQLTLIMQVIYFMDVVDARIMKCKDITILVDKEMRERKIEYQKFIIRLEDNKPFKADEFVKVIRKSDFDKLGDLINSVKNEGIN